MKIKKYMIRISSNQNMTYPITQLSDINYTAIEQCLLCNTIHEVKDFLRMYGISDYLDTNNATCYIDVVELTYELQTQDSYYLPKTAKSIIADLVGESGEKLFGQPIYDLYIEQDQRSLYVGTKSKLIKMLRENLRASANYGITQSPSIQYGDRSIIYEVKSKISYDTVKQLYKIGYSATDIPISNL